MSEDYVWFAARQWNAVPFRELGNDPAGACDPPERVTLGARWGEEAPCGLSEHLRGEGVTEPETRRNAATTVISA